MNDAVGNLLLNMQSGLKPEDLSPEEINLLRSEFGDSWKKILGYESDTVRPCENCGYHDCLEAKRQLERLRGEYRRLREENIALRDLWGAVHAYKQALKLEENQTIQWMEVVNMLDKLNQGDF